MKNSLLWLKFLTVISIFIICRLYNICHLEMRFADSFLIMSGNILKCVLQYHVANLVWSKISWYEDLHKHWRKWVFLVCFYFQKCAPYTVKCLELYTGAHAGCHICMWFFFPMLHFEWWLVRTQGHCCQSFLSYRIPFLLASAVGKLLSLVFTSKISYFIIALTLSPLPRINRYIHVLICVHACILLLC